MCDATRGKRAAVIAVPGMTPTPSPPGAVSNRERGIGITELPGPKT
jgi:hypothetical protein